MADSSGYGDLNTAEASLGERAFRLNDELALAQQVAHGPAGGSWPSRWLMAQQVAHGPAGGSWPSRWLKAPPRTQEELPGAAPWQTAPVAKPQHREGGYLLTMSSHWVPFPEAGAPEMMTFRGSAGAAAAALCCARTCRGSRQPQAAQERRMETTSRLVSPHGLPEPPTHARGEKSPL